MVANRMSGYAYLLVGVFFILFFAWQLFFQIVCLLVGASFIMQGLRMLAVDRTVYYYSQNYFKDQFKR
ncbi:hypothetical protein [Candidatus Chromulinivorax destructor]|uniref:Uncharacterized protein n=1 Tax=Candidatus Chromulinivorax destructor TaxID=2066483 RepID=A0A345ZBJ6_9BACT|nr:hypothetical protein [Candidatus Chromulinivorax destructor]AXK60663.1 hypothetical protein C0J27_02800 [Candidatus Chromulinivorax destructor]